MVNLDTLPSPEACACGGTGWAHVVRDGVQGVVQCVCQKRKIAMAYLSQLDPIFYNADLETVQPINPAQKEYLRLLREGDYVGAANSFFFFGRYREGKTHLLAAQYVYLSKRGTICFFRTAQQLADELYDHYVGQPVPDQPGSSVKVPSPILQAFHDRQRVKPVHVFLDDIEKINFDRTAFRKEVMHNFVDTIVRKDGGLSVTSNMQLGRIGELELLPQSVIARIDDLTVKVEFP